MNPLTTTFRLPLETIGLTHLPAFPFNIASTLETLGLLKLRQEELSPVIQGYSTQYTIGQQTAPAREFLYGESSSGGFVARCEALASDLRKMLEHEAHVIEAVWDTIIGDAAQANTTSTPPALTSLPLEKPEQFTIAWTTYQNIYAQALPQAADFAGALSSVEQASRQFWPMIAEHGQAYNLLILHKAGAGDTADLRSAFGEVWTPDIEDSHARGELFYIDLRLFGSANAVGGAPDLFTPATFTLLRRDPATKTLLPIAVIVSGENGANGVLYTPQNAKGGAWIYALEAVRTSVTIYGIAIGHVYHWHLATAALFMTFGQTVPEHHPLQNLIAPQSNFVMGFDDVLLLLWSDIVPPMSVASGLDFLKLADRFATGRTFYDDDPMATLARLGLRQEDFTDKSPWDLYPVAADLLNVWASTTAYVDAFVDYTYASDGDVANDEGLQSWVAASVDPSNGNVVGLGPIATKAAVSKFLQSLIFRVTMHGVSRINQTAYPTLSFAANYPTCLNGRDIPPAAAPMSTTDILSRLPNTGQIGQIMSFYNIFVFTPPYESFIPSEGADTRLQFPDGEANPCNQALIKYRNEIGAFITHYQKLHIATPAQEFQWPLCIET